MYKFENVKVVNSADCLAESVTINNVELLEWLNLEDGDVYVERVDSHLTHWQSEDLIKAGISEDDFNQFVDELEWEAQSAYQFICLVASTTQPPQGALTWIGNTMTNEELLKERHSDFVAFCSLSGLTKQKKYAGKIMQTLDYDLAQEVFGLKRRSLESFWNGKALIPEYVYKIMLLHTGQTPPLFGEDSDIKLTIKEN